MISREKVFNDTGYQDSCYFMYVEDVDLSIKAVKSHWKISYIHDADVYHNIQVRSENNRGFKPLLHSDHQRFEFYVFQIFRNHALMVYEDGDALQKCKFIFGFPLFSIKTIVIYLFHFRFKIKLQLFQGLADFWKIRNISALAADGTAAAHQE